MNADKALELARLAYPNDENLRVAYMLGLNAGAEWQYQKDRYEFAKLKAKEWMSGYDDAMSQFVKIPYTDERWFSTTDGEFIAGALFEEPIPADAELYYRTKKED